MLIPTVKIAAPHKRQGYKIINECDFDPSCHDLYQPRTDAGALTEPAPLTDQAQGMSDDMLRNTIEALTGEMPHHRTGRAKLEAMYAEAVAKA